MVSKLAWLAVGTLGVLACAAQTSVTTYHYDNNRTGWNSQETLLTPASVAGPAFGLRQVIDLDGQVDAQPLVVANVMITSGSQQGPHDVVYVATSAASLYAVDVHSGTVLIRRHFGSPVVRPLGCTNNAPTVGITSTPVIDLSTGTFYVMVYSQDAGGPAYHLHAVDLGSLADKMTPRLVTGSQMLTDGTTFTFNAAVQRQRPGLVLSNGTIYAGFGSFCDASANISRGWLLGWEAASLAPLAGNQLFDTQASSPNSVYLSSIWMSGYAPAVDYLGNILVVTGNSDHSGTTYDGVSNLQESVVKVAPSLTRVLDLFTPSNQSDLDQIDADFGAGGVLVLPDQAGPVRHIAVAAGKDGNMYLMNEDNLGGYSTTVNSVLGTYQIGGCWCGRSYFSGSTGGGNIVSSGGNNVILWSLETSPTVRLKKIATSPVISGGQNPGFFTSVSSNGTASPIIWALSHPSSRTNVAIFLLAFDPQKGMIPIFHGVAGQWPKYSGNSNLVPVVANGQVFVASYRQLQIFGIWGH